MAKPAKKPDITDATPRKRAKALSPDQGAFAFDVPQGATLVYTTPPGKEADAMRAFLQSRKASAETAQAHDRRAGNIMLSVSACADWKRWNTDQRNLALALAKEKTITPAHLSGNDILRTVREIVAQVDASAAPPAPPAKKRAKGGNDGERPPAPPAKKRGKVNRQDVDPDDESVWTEDFRRTTPARPPAPAAEEDTSDLLNKALAYAQRIDVAARANPSAVAADARAIVDAITSLHIALRDAKPWPAQWLRKRGKAK